MKNYQSTKQKSKPWPKTRVHNVTKKRSVSILVTKSINTFGFVAVIIIAELLNERNLIKIDVSMKQKTEMGSTSSEKAYISTEAYQLKQQNCCGKRRKVS